MKVKKLRLNNFRNYESADIDFYKGINVIYGENGQGKTNLLEAIYLCSCGRSHRTSKDNDLIKIGEDGYFVNLELESESVLPVIEILSRKNDNKRIRINKTSIKKMGQLMGVLRTVMFSPEDLLIIKQGPSERRRFIDVFISQIKPAYFFDIQKYSKILKNRNKLLKEINFKSSLRDTLSIWDTELAQTGASLIQTRNEFINMLSDYAYNKHRQLSNDLEYIKLIYSPSIKCTNFDKRKDIEQLFLETLNKYSELEILKGTTLYGPQRDDFNIFLNKNDIRSFGSQGQQRTAVLSIKMAQIDIIANITGDNPVLLLDDVMSELDLLRQNFLTLNLTNIQSFVTTTDPTIFKTIDAENISFFKVENGSVFNTKYSKNPLRLKEI